MKRTGLQAIDSLVASLGGVALSHDRRDTGATLVG